MKKLLAICVILVVVVFNIAATTPTVSASKVSFKYCEATYGSATVDLIDGDYHGTPLTETGTMVVTIQNHRGCDSIVTLTVTDSLDGAIKHAFSVAATQKVYFSKGNLQYCAAPTSGETTHTVRGGSTKAGIWRFAEHQWDVVATKGLGTVFENGVRCDNALRSETYSGWIDLFKIATSGKSAQPYTNSYYSSKNSSSAYNIIQTDYDWGWYNAISNGGDQAGKWFTMSLAQWQYLLYSRAGAANKFGGALVNNVYGMIILPDVWALPSGCKFTKQSDASVNQYTIEQWEKMEANGAVFLPIAGRCNYGSSSSTWSDAAYIHTGFYWIGTNYPNSSYRYDFYVSFSSSSTTFSYPTSSTTSTNEYGYNNNAVRLVRYVYY